MGFIERRVGKHSLTKYLAGARSVIKRQRVRRQTVSAIDFWASITRPPTHVAIMLSLELFWQIRNKEDDAEGGNNGSGVVIMMQDRREHLLDWGRAHLRERGRESPIVVFPARIHSPCVSCQLKPLAYGVAVFGFLAQGYILDSAS